MISTPQVEWRTRRVSETYELSESAGGQILLPEGPWLNPVPEPDPGLAGNAAEIVDQPE